MALSGSRVLALCSNPKCRSSMVVYCSDGFSVRCVDCGCEGSPDYQRWAKWDRLRRWKSVQLLRSMSTQAVRKVLVKCPSCCNSFFTSAAHSMALCRCGHLFSVNKNMI